MKFAAVAYAVVSLVAFSMYVAGVTFTAHPKVFDALFSFKLRAFDADAAMAKYGLIVQNLQGSVANKGST